MKKIIVSLLATTCSMQLFAQGTFQLSSGTAAKPTGGIYLVFNNMNLVNDGTLQQAAGDGTIKFAGINDGSISGSGITTIDNLLLQKGGTANLTLQTNISIASEINFTSGLLNLGNSVLDLGVSGILTNESETSRAYSSGTGYMQSTQTLNAPSSINAGNLGAIITSSANMGSTVIKRGFTSNGNITGGESILRYYVITPTNNTALNATYRFEYLDAELNGLTKSSLDFWKSPDNVNWTDNGFTTRDTINNYAEKTGINDFSFWTLAPHFSALPVTLSKFNAHKSGNDIELTWKVLAALNVKNYEIERSADGANFTAIGELPATGTTNYIYMDYHPFKGTNFYRLGIVDKDGSIKYSGIVEVNVNSRDAQISFFPNPVIDNIVTLQLTNVLKGSYQLRVFNNVGKLVYSSVVEHSGGSATQTIYLPLKLSSGIYPVQLKGKAILFNVSLFIK